MSNLRFICNFSFHIIITTAWLYGLFVIFYSEDIFALCIKETKLKPPQISLSTSSSTAPQSVRTVITLIQQPIPYTFPPPSTFPYKKSNTHPHVILR